MAGQPPPRAEEEALRGLALEGHATPLELSEDVVHRDSPADAVSIEASGDVFAVVIVDSQNWIAAVRLAELAVGLATVQGIDEDGDEAPAGFDDA